MLRLKKKILVVEDEPDLVLMVKERLKSQGYSVYSAFDGVEGLKKAKQLKPDLVMLDIMMPKLDGYSMAKRLKEDDVTTGIPVIVVSIKETMKDLFRGLGITHYFTKPFDKDALLAAIKNILEQNA